MNNLTKYNARRKAAAKAQRKAAKHSGQTAVHIMLNNEEIERRYFHNYEDALKFVAEVDSGKYIKGATAYTNY